MSVTVRRAVHLDDERLDWRLTVTDSAGTEFEVEIWQTHDPLTEWEVGVTYVIRGGYGQTWNDGTSKKLHSSKKWSADRVDTSHDCRLMVMGDTHIGRANHPSKPYRSIDCVGRFREAVEVGLTHDVDGIVHTGDVFHDAVTRSECRTVDETFERMREYDVQFSYVLGNHECERGTRLLRQWENRGVGTHLDMSGSQVADGVTVYGYDHVADARFSVDDMDVPTTLPDRFNLLVLHQTLSPFRRRAHVDLDEINERTREGFDYVVSGHLHDPEKPAWEQGEFLYAGSVENLSVNPAPSDPSVWLLTVKDGSVDTRRRRM